MTTTFSFTLIENKEVKMQSVNQETSLIEDIKNGDVSAFDKIYHKYTPKLSAFLLIFLQNREDVEDATQETWINVTKGLLHFSPGEASFSTWLYKIARNTAITMKRKQHSQMRDERQTISLNQITGQDEYGNELTVIDQTPNSTLNPGESVIQDELAEANHAILRKLGKPGQMLYLRHVIGLTVEEVAKIFNTTKNTVSVRMSEASRKFRRIAGSLQYAGIYESYLR
jgi:RNA polymerase sigma-70 factor (ECF subfamily)